MNKAYVSPVHLTLAAVLFAAAMAAAQTVTLTSPVNKEAIAACSDIVIHAEPSNIDAANIKNVAFFRNDAGIASDSKAPYEYTWKTAFPGFFKLQAKMTDKSSNVYTSDPIWINVGNTEPGEKIGNGTFSCGKTNPWALNLNNGGNATMAIDSTNSYLDSPDSTALVVTIINPSTSDWHIQLNQPFPITAGHTYVLSFTAGADASRPISFEVQGNSGSYPIYWSQNLTIDHTDTYGPYVFTNDTTNDANAYFRFNLGATTHNFFVDDVSFVDPDETGVKETQNRNPEKPQSFLMSQNYPNPFNPSTTIEYSLPEAARVSIDIFNMQGQKVRTLVDQQQNSGVHRISWNGTDQKSVAMPTGLYVYQIKAQTAEKTISIQKKILLVE
jgi:hypothetical protein